MLKKMMQEQSEKPEATITETLRLVPAADATVAGKPRGLAATFTRNTALSVGRLVIASLVALVLPAYLTHKLPVQTYSAWVLILQLGGYVAFLDFGVQNAVSKYVSEYEARGDSVGVNLRASAGLAIMLCMSVLGLFLTLILAWRVPQLFHDMPVALYRDVRITLVFVGGSLSFSLFCSVFSAIFLGLQRYAVPVFISILNRILFTGAVCTAVLFHSSLVTMGAAVACVNIATGLLQIIMWRKLASRIRVSLYRLDGSVLKKMVAYCSVLAIWSAAMLCVSGLDVAIVGRYDFSQTGFYSIATLPINFIIAIMGAGLGPFLPTSSALSTQRTPAEMGNLLSRTTRYTTILLVLSGLPLLVSGYPILRFWVGSNYALQSIGYLRILVLANIVRMLCAPYATMVVATSQQRLATASAISEGLVNLSSSILLARYLGAYGVAIGTLIGSFVGVAMHFGISMRYTRSNLAISRRRLFLDGILRPAVMAIPTIVLIPYWWISGAPEVSTLVWVIWAGTTLLLAWYVSMNSHDRGTMTGMMNKALKPILSSI